MFLAHGRRVCWRDDVLLITHLFCGRPNQTDLFGFRNWLQTKPKSSFVGGRQCYLFDRAADGRLAANRSESAPSSRPSAARRRSLASNRAGRLIVQLPPALRFCLMKRVSGFRRVHSVCFESSGFCSQSSLKWASRIICGGVSAFFLWVNGRVSHC